MLRTHHGKVVGLVYDRDEFSAKVLDAIMLHQILWDTVVLRLSCGFLLPRKFYRKPFSGRILGILCVIAGRDDSRA